MVLNVLFHKIEWQLIIAIVFLKVKEKLQWQQFKKYNKQLDVQSVKQ
jgi:hypothetical protein